MGHGWRPAVLIASDLEGRREQLAESADLAELARRLTERAARDHPRPAADSRG